MTTPSKAALERAHKIRNESWGRGDESPVTSFALELDRVDRIAREAIKCPQAFLEDTLSQIMLPDPEPTPETHEAWHLAGQSSPIEFQRRLDAAGLTVVRKEDE